MIFKFLIKMFIKSFLDIVLVGIFKRKIDV